MPNEWPVNVNRHIYYSIASIAQLRFDRQSVSGLTFPVLTVHGTKDRNAPYDGGREWASILPDARLLTVSGAAHAILLERPDVVLPALRTFLGGRWPDNAVRVSPVTFYGQAITTSRLDSIRQSNPLVDPASFTPRQSRTRKAFCPSARSESAPSKAYM
jgi:TAP-like protein